MSEVGPSQIILIFLLLSLLGKLVRMSAAMILTLFFATNRTKLSEVGLVGIHLATRLTGKPSRKSFLRERLAQFG
jgi:hypothetical protein